MDKAYYYVYNFVTVGAVMVALMFYLLQSGESSVKKHMQIGIELKTSKRDVVILISELVVSFSAGLLIYVILFSKGIYKNNSPHNTIELKYMIFIIVSYSLWLLTIFIQIRYDKYISRVIRESVKKWEKNLQLFIQLFITMGHFIYFTIIILDLSLSDKPAKDIQNTFTAVLLFEIVTIIFIFILHGMIDKARILCETKEFEILFKDQSIKRMKIFYNDNKFIWVLSDDKRIECINMDVLERISETANNQMMDSACNEKLRIEAERKKSLRDLFIMDL